MGTALRIEGPRLFTVCAAFAFAIAGCGDSGTDSETAPSSTSSAATTGTDGTTDSTATDATTTGTSTTTTSSGGSTDTDGDPNYPPPVGGLCNAGTAMIEVGGGQVCGPYCSEEGSMCPTPVMGDALPECEPFIRGGSMDACADSSACAGEEVCHDRQCVLVAFWACRLTCGGGENCPGGLACIEGVCVYPP